VEEWIERKKEEEEATRLRDVVKVNIGRAGRRAVLAKFG